jgi:predicted XRE-type DNA-binding protein
LIGNWRDSGAKKRTRLHRQQRKCLCRSRSAKPEEALAKAELANKIIVLIREKRLTQAQAAKLLGVDQPKVSALLRGNLTGFSLERLMRFLLRLGQDIRITVHASPSRRSQVRVLVA